MPPDCSARLRSLLYDYQGTVNRHQNGTNLHQAKPGIEKFRAVGQHHTHAVASADTQAEEATGYPIDRGVKVGIGCDLVLKDHERFFGVLPYTTFQELSDVHQEPPLWKPHRAGRGGATLPPWCESPKMSATLIMTD